MTYIYNHMILKQTEAYLALQILLLTDIYKLILCIVTAHFTPEYIWFKA